MDRFVWFVLLVVVSHLVAEYTRVVGHGRGSATNAVTVNDSYVPSQVNVQNMILYPNQDILIKPNKSKQQQSMFYQILAATANNAQKQQQHYEEEQQQQALAQSSWMSFRPIIDSIFEIPISTLRAVNNLVTRLTGSYKTAPRISMNADSVLPYEHFLKRETTVELRESKVKVKPHKLVTMSTENS